LNNKAKSEDYLVNTGNFEPITCNLKINKLNVTRVTAVRRFVPSLDQVGEIFLPSKADFTANTISIALTCKEVDVEVRGHKVREALESPVRECWAYAARTT
jgi:hypothetical protein